MRHPQPAHKDILNQHTNHNYPTKETNKSKNNKFWQHSEGRKTHSPPLPTSRAHLCFFLFCALPSLTHSLTARAGSQPQGIRAVVGKKQKSHTPNRKTQPPRSAGDSGEGGSGGEGAAAPPPRLGSEHIPNIGPWLRLG